MIRRWRNDIGSGRRGGGDGSTLSAKLLLPPLPFCLEINRVLLYPNAGSSKSGFLGEAHPLTISLPLKFANSCAVLNVTIEKIHGASDLRFIEENKDQTLTKEDDDSEGYNQICKERSLDVRQAKNAALGGSFDSIVESGLIDGSDGNSSMSQQHNSVPAAMSGHRRSNTDWSASSIPDESYIESRNSPCR